jgi:hypothetical protein
MAVAREWQACVSCTRQTSTAAEVDDTRQGPRRACVMQRGTTQMLRRRLGSCSKPDELIWRADDDDVLA